MLKWSCVLAALISLLLCSCASKIPDTKIPDGGKYYQPDGIYESAVTNDSSAADSSSADSQSGDDDKDNGDDNSMYDVSHIVKAYHTGDRSMLSELDNAILDKAAAVLDEIIMPDMDDYQKELAVHDYIISNCEYDEGELSVIPSPTPNSDNPYGALIGGYAICKGYTATFRMFMGMLGIPCGTVHSIDHTGDEHAWNTVQLGGSWYYVDVTWDDPVPDRGNGLIRHEFFNVTREKIEERHVLPDGCPDTDSLEFTYASRSAFPAGQTEQAFEWARENNFDSFAVYCEDKTAQDIPDDMYEAAEELLEDNGCELSRTWLTECENGSAVLIEFDEV